tara:strand:+ start:2352 stop:2906 length:555 start_codon:yes stop_codon:yes gene_type:complete
MKHFLLKTIGLVVGVVWLVIESDELVNAMPKCQPLDKRPVKLEVWLSKKYQGDFRYLRKEFGAMGDTKVALWLYPAENPSGSVAIGRCVPAFIARHALQRAMAHTKGVKSLVHQSFFSPHWIGVGTSLFSELSQKKVTTEQVDSLLDDTLTTREFQELYREYTEQEEVVMGFGIEIPNPKLMGK